MAMPGPRATAAATNGLSAANPSMGMVAGERDAIDARWQQHFNGESPQPPALDDFGGFGASMAMPINDVAGNFTWEMIGLGLEEPLPPQETIDEMHQLYFEKVHPSLPMIHRYRYLAAMNLYVCCPFDVHSPFSRPFAPWRRRRGVGPAPLD